MLSINDKGVPIAKIVGGKYDNKVISAEDKPTSKSDFKVLGITSDAKLQLVPNPDTERQILYITGPSGSGRSTFAQTYLEENTLGDIEPQRLRLDSSIYAGLVPHPRTPW